LLGGPTVLVVDDNLSILEALGVALDDEFNVRFARSIYEAIREAGKNDVRVLLLDDDLGHESGVDALNLLHLLFPKTRIYVTGALTRLLDYETLLANGATGTLPKPWNVEHLRATVRAGCIRRAGANT